MKICTAAQMHNIDRAASEIGGIPSIVLMENAALACVAEIERHSPARVAVFCGKGNNGGDGLAIARHLINLGVHTEVFLVCGSDFSGDALINFEILEKMGVKITEIKDITDISFLEYCILAQDMIIDAILGTGIRGAVSGLTADVIEMINHAKKILSVDIPSGVNADTGEVASVAVKADITVTFAAYKRGLFLYPGADFAGRIIVADISIPEYIIEDEHINLQVIDRQLVKKLLPERVNNSHKGDYGKVLIAGGGVGMTGAPALAAQAALFCGSGLVTAAIPESLNAIMESKLTEAMTFPLSEKDGQLTDSAFYEFLVQLSKSDALLFGPGIGRSAHTSKFLHSILSHSKIPVVVDADGLYLLSENLDILNNCGCNLIFTPHEMEFARLLGTDVEDVCHNRLEYAKDFALKYGVTLVLKGHYTIVSAPNGMQYINTTGNSGMATGGSGDVLGGMITAFTAYGLDETDAAVLAVYLHGCAGDHAKEKFGEFSMTAGNICECIKCAISDITSGKSSRSML